MVFSQVRRSRDNHAISSPFFRGSQAPASLGIIISNEQVDEAKSSASWDAFSHIKKVNKINDHTFRFFDSSGGVQNVSILATGDYNGDGIEDLVININNSLTGGDYTSQFVYVLSKESPNSNFKVIKEFLPINF